ncbi:MAG TPA: hypothetical protein VK037_08000 [Pseudogracilibacillus sp.]|nr:hypothetical protein [Pseudogracilibacillus sp.]
MRIPIRYFSIGLLTASIVLLIMFLITDDGGQAIEEYSVEELSEAIEDKGYRVITQDDFISFSMYLDEQKNVENNDEEKEKKDKEKEQKDKKDTKSDKEKKKDKDEKDKKKDKEKDKRKKATVRVKQGDVIKDIGDRLKDEGIIKDVNEFVAYMEDNDYSPYLQIGSFKVHSDMSLKEIAETLTTYPGN